MISLLGLVFGCVLLGPADIEEWRENYPCAHPLPYWQDLDSDGWGDGGTPPEFQCGGSGNFTAQNDLDCADSDADMGPRVSAACPETLVGGSFFSFTDEGIEYLIVLEPTVPMIGPAAERVCATWGGHLARIDRTAERFSLLSEMVSHQPWTGMIGLRADPGTADWTWAWTDGWPPGPEAPEWCGAVPLAERTEDRVALRIEDGEACLELPRGNRALFACERAAPDPADWRWIQLRAGEPR